MSYSRKYYEENKEKIIKQIKAWQFANKESLSLYNKERYKENKKNNKEKLNEYYRVLYYKIREREEIPNRKYSFYRDFLKPFFKLNIINLNRQLFDAKLTIKKLTVLEKVSKGIGLQSIGNEMNYKISYISHILRNLKKVLSPIILNFETENENLIKLISRLRDEK